ncbi:MAG: hypothetical protein NTV25_04285 [Methanothrix sp.]|nr:hypothetical protein [Methanothrix sp.]
MAERTLFEGKSPKTQRIEAVKALLAYVGRGCDPLPSDVTLDDGRVVLVLSNKKDAFYTVTAEACSCPAQTFSPGQPCKHQRKYFPQKAEPVRTLNLADEIKPAGRWPGGMNGPVNLQAGV